MTVQQNLEAISHASKRTSLTEEQFWDALAKLAGRDHVLRAALEKGRLEHKIPRPTASAQPITV